jgi:prepilin-type N-terminal cleavage/methylation domain-containing protein/prepilin-type processing-associated H-X9-DG protein
MKTEVLNRGLSETEWWLVSGVWRRPGFTLVELLVVLAVIGILAALLLPVLSKGKQRAQQAYCLSNGHQLILALHQYAAEARDLLPPNPDDGNTIQGHNWCSGSAGIGQSAEFNPDLLKDPTRSLLTGYLSGNVAVFRCPADRRQGVYQGSDPRLAGQIVPAARTISMSQAVGTICPGYDEVPPNFAGVYPGHAGAPTLAVNGPWLNNRRTNRRNAPWITYGKISQILAPGPAQLWVFVDEDARNLNDAAFAFGMERPQWFDIPGTYHNGGCGFAFADGHSESHQWRFPSPKTGKQAPVANQQDLQDWLWMRDHTSAHISGTMPAPGTFQE